MEFKNLEKWKNNLDGCIRCGYCFQHCPVSKQTGWESDTPRAKLIMLFGLLTGRLEPTEYMAEKLFSCFYCKRCVAACSSGVPLTDIFTDAKADFVELGFDTEGTTSVTGDNCARCLICLDLCPHDARSYSAEENRIVTDRVKCQSCGICVAICPARAARNSLDYGAGCVPIMEQVEGFFDKSVHPNAKAAVFVCNWANYPGLQSSYGPDSNSDDPEYKIWINMCGGRLQTQLLLAPMLAGAHGVLVSCCPEGECEHNGNLKARKQVNGLKKMFIDMDIDPARLHLVEIAHGNVGDLNKEINEFMKKMNELGPIA